MEMQQGGLVTKLVKHLDTTEGHVRASIETSLINMAINVPAAAREFMTKGGFEKLVTNLRNAANDPDPDPNYLEEAIVNMRDLLVDERENVVESFGQKALEIGILEILSKLKDFPVRDASAEDGVEQVSEVAEELIEALIQFKDKPAPQK
jgi:hypothetical protein